MAASERRVNEPITAYFAAQRLGGISALRCKPRARGLELALHVAEGPLDRTDPLFIEEVRRQCRILSFALVNFSFSIVDISSEKGTVRQRGRIRSPGPATGSQLAAMELTR